jgi:hypothetical protein
MVGLSADAVSALLAVALLVVAGCAQPDAPSDAGSPSQEEDCQLSTGSTDGTATAEILCENAEGTGTHEQAFTCPEPGTGNVSLAGNISSGAITVTVVDGAEERVVKQTYRPGGPFNDTKDVRDTEAGNWTLRIDRNRDLAGGFFVQATCPR